MRLGEEVDQRFGDDRADAVDRIDFLAPRLRACGVAQRGEIAKVARQAARIGLANMAYAERIDEAIDRNRATRLDRREYVARRDFAKALALAQWRPILAVTRGKRKNIGGGLDEAFIEKQFDLLVAEAFDVKRVTRAEMLELLDRLRRTDERASAAPHDVGDAGLLVDLSQRSGPAGGADEIAVLILREHERLCPPGPLVEEHFENLRNDIAGALDAHRIADAHILARDLVLVVQRRVRHDHAADGHRLEFCHRRQRSRAPDLNLDSLDNCRRLFRWKLMRRGPARAARDEAEPLLQRETVDLVDNAVDVIAERRALRLDGAKMSEHFRFRMTQPGQRICRQAKARECFDHPVLGLRGQSADLAPCVSEESQRTPRCNVRIELAQRTRRSVARIGEYLFVRCLLALVQRGKIGMRHVNFAANFENFWRAVKFLRDRLNRLHIARDVLAFKTIAARRRLNQAPMFEAQRARQPVDLRLRRHSEISGFGKAEKASHAIAKFADFLVGKNVAERQHRHCVPHLGEFFRWRGANAPVLRVGASQCRKRCLDRRIALAQGVVFRVGNNRRVLAVIALVVLGDLRAELRVFLARFGRGQGFDRRLLGHGGKLSQALAGRKPSSARWPASSASSGAIQAKSGIWWRAQVNWRLA